MATTQTRLDELKHRVSAKRKELEARLEHLRADAQGAQADSRDATQRKLRELDETVRDGWDDMKESTIKRLNDWLQP